VTDILARKLVQRAQRHAARHHASEHIQQAQRLATVELLLDGVSAQVTCHSIMLGTTQAVNDPGVITATIRIGDEVALAELALRLWTPAELDAFAAQKAESDPS